MKVTNDILYIGVNDHQIDLFEGQYPVPNGISYNSYVIIDDKIAVLDTVDHNFTHEWLNNLENALNGRKPDYLVVHHMEPDHSANIMVFMNKYSEAIIVSSLKAFNMMSNFFGSDFLDRRIVVSDNDALCLGKHTLRFYTAPMVHWPEVIMSYEENEKILFSADAFGTFGALDVDQEWDSEARRYYFGIVGKYGISVQALFKKLCNLDIKIICSLHGQVLKENICHYVNLYNIWSSYESEIDGIFIAYTSIYGNTKEAAQALANKLKEKGYTNVVIKDLGRCDMSEAVAIAFSYSKLVIASPTYNGDVFPPVKEFINHLTQRAFKNKVVGFIENGSWSPNAIKVMKLMLESSKNLTYAVNEVKIMSALKEKNYLELEALANELIHN